MEHLESEIERPSSAPSSLIPAAGSTLCEFCRSLFMQKTTSQSLSSKAGLRYRRSLRHLLRSALDGCSLCRELSCIDPHWGPLKGGPKVRSSPNNYGPQTKTTWPMDFWASTLAMIESEYPP